MNIYPVGFTVLNGGIRPSKNASLSSVAREIFYFGREAIGGEIHMEVQTVKTGSYISAGVVTPDDTPVVRIYASGLRPRNYLVPVDPTSSARNRRNVFHSVFTPGPTDSASHGSALFSYIVGGIPRAFLGVFEVLPNGHAGGCVQGSFVVGEPAGDAMIVHETSGRVLFGKRPYLDPGNTL